MTDKNQIHELLPKVMQEIGAIGKENRNSHQGYMFRGIDDALNHISPILSRNGVSVSFVVTGHKMDEKPYSKGIRYHTTLNLTQTFYAPDGSSVSNTAAGEAMDSNGDKSTNKAMSAAMKYCLFFGLMVPIDEKSLDTSDGEGKHDHEEASAQNEQEQEPAYMQDLQLKCGEDGVEGKELMAAARSAEIIPTSRKFKDLKPTEAKKIFNSWDTIIDQIRKVRLGENG